MFGGCARQVSGQFGNEVFLLPVRLVGRYSIYYLLKISEILKQYL